MTEFKNIGLYTSSVNSEKIFIARQIEEILNNVKAKNGDIIFFSAGSDNLVNSILSTLRSKIANEKGFLEDSWKFLWVTDFPMFENDPESKKWKCLHHPFTMPISENSLPLFIKEITVLNLAVLSISF